MLARVLDMYVDLNQQGNTSPLSGRPTFDIENRRTNSKTPERAGGVISLLVASLKGE